MPKYVSKLKELHGLLRDEVIFDDISASLVQHKVINVKEYQNITNEVNDTARVDVLVEILTRRNKDEDVVKLGKVLSKDYDELSKMLEAVADEQQKDETDSIPTVLSSELVEYQNLVNAGIEDLNTKCGADSCVVGTGSRVPGWAPSRKRNSQGAVVGTLSSPIVIDLEGSVQSERCCVGEDTVSDEKKLRLNQVVTKDMINVVRKNYRVSKGWTSLAHTLGLSSQVYNIRLKILSYVEDPNMAIRYLLEEWVGLQSVNATLLKLMDALREEGFNDVADELESKFVS